MKSSKYSGGTLPAIRLVESRSPLRLPSTHTHTHTQRESEILLLGDEILVDTADERRAYQEENIAHGSSVRRDEESGHTEHFNCLGEGLVAVHLPDLPVALRDVIARREGVVEEPVSATGQSRGYPSRPPSSAPIALF